MTSGKCGDNLTWTFDDDGTLTISGRGVMYKYLFPDDAPWGSLRELIKKVVIEIGMTTISKRAFRDCTSLTSVIIPDSVTKIKERAFSDCKSLTSVIIPSSVMTIGKSAFKGCTSLASVIIPDSVTTIGKSAFYACTSLKSVIIPDSVTTIGYRIFCACTSLKSVIIPDSVTMIDHWAFSGCTSLTSVIIPSSVTVIGGRVFNYCTSLKEIYYKRGTKINLHYLPVGNNAQLIPYDELPPAQVKPPAQIEPPAQAEPSFKLTPLQTQPSLFDSPPPAEKNCTVYKNTKTDRPENIAPPNAKKLKLVDENIAEIRRAAELAAMNIVMTIERDLGFAPEDVSSQNLGYDIKSTSRDGKTSRLIEVKGRHIDAETVTVSRNEIDAALNNPDDFILAIVRLDGGNNETTYIRKPFELPPDRAALSVNFSIQKLVEVSG